MSPATPRWWLATGLALLASCGAGRRADELPPEADSPSRVDLFLRALEPGPAPVTMHIERVELIDADGGRVELELRRSLVDSEDARQQIELAGGPVPPATFTALALTLAGAELRESDGARPLRLLPPDVGPSEGPDPLEGLVTETPPERVEYQVPIGFQLARNQAISAFLDWRVAASLIENTGFRPALSPSLARPQVRYSLLYVTDPATGSVRALDRRTGEIVATGKAGERPSALVATRLGFDLFVANAGDGSVTALDSRTYQINYSVPIRLGAEPADIVLAVPAFTLAVANSALDTVSLIEIPTGNRFADVRVGRRPIRLVALPELERVYSVNWTSDDVSVIDARGARLVARIPVESRPSCIATDRFERELFVGHDISPNLVVLDPRTFAPTASFLVSEGTTEILADRRRDRIYVAARRPPTLFVVDRQLESVLRQIPLSAPVQRLVQPPDGALIYGASAQANGLVAIDVVVGRETGVLACGAPVSDVAIAE